MQNQNVRTSIFDKDLNLGDLIKIIINRKRVSLFFIIFFSLFGVFYSLSLSNIYQSTIKLIPQEELSISSQSFNGLTSLLGGGKASRSKRQIFAEELISSQKFVDNFILKHELAEPLLLPKKWDKKTGSLVADTSQFFTKKNPSQQEIMDLFSPMERVKIFMANLEYEYDDDSNLVEMSFAHLSPIVATKILGLLVEDINMYIQQYEIKRASMVYDNLKTNLVGEKVSDVRAFITELMQLQLKTIMMANDDEFVYRIIDGPILPENKYRPVRSLICIMFSVIGLFIGFFASLISHYFKIDKLGKFKLLSTETP